MSNDREQKIKNKAHEIWIREGSPSGREREHWKQAEEEIDLEQPQGQNSKPDRRNAQGEHAGTKHDPEEFKP